MFRIPSAGGARAPAGMPAHKLGARKIAPLCSPPGIAVVLAEADAWFSVRLMSAGRKTLASI